MHWLNWVAVGILMCAVVLMIDTIRIMKRTNRIVKQVEEMHKPPEAGSVSIQCRDCKVLYPVNMTSEQYTEWCKDYSMRDFNLTENDKTLMITGRCIECTNSK